MLLNGSATTSRPPSRTHASTLVGRAWSSDVDEEQCHVGVGRRHARSGVDLRTEAAGQLDERTSCRCRLSSRIERLAASVVRGTDEQRDQSAGPPDEQPWHHTRATARRRRRTHPGHAFTSESTSPARRRNDCTLVRARRDGRRTTQPRRDPMPRRTPPPPPRRVFTELDDGTHPSSVRGRRATCRVR